MKETCTYFQFFESITATTTVLTPNRRLSKTLAKRYADYQINLQNQCWHTADILPINAWIERTWQDTISRNFNNEYYLLNNIQEQFLWEKILENAKESEHLLQISETADIARSAHQLLKQWLIDVNHPAFDSAEDYRALKKWIQSFESTCANKRWIYQSSLINKLCNRIKLSEVKLPTNILLVGFTELSPQLSALIKSLEIDGCKIKLIALVNENVECNRISLANLETEILTMARWAKSIIAHDAKVTIGCVIPSLDKKREQVSQIFSEVFSDHDAEKDFTNIVNISAGKSLSRYPVIHSALQFLNLHKKNIPLDTISYFLASPHLAGAEKERIKRSLFDLSLKQANINTLSLTQLIKFPLISSCPILAKNIQKFLTLLHDIPEKTIFSEWLQIFNDLLLSLGWPGERSLNSEEYQVTENWLKLLNDLNSLNHVSSTLNYQHALQMLYKVANKKIFQPKTPEAPIQVLGLLEAASLPFDYLWVAGLDDLSWPPEPKPNPLIPKSIQREQQMPHATSVRELFFCETLTQQFKQSAKHLIFSHAEKNDELELHTSSLIQAIPEITEQSLLLLPFVAKSETIYSTKKIEYIHDDIAPTIKPNEKIRGGVTTLKYQALCPFKAFAECRLHAREIEETMPGLRGKDRGAIIHKIMELLWNKLQDQKTLKTIPDIHLHNLLNECIDDALIMIPHARNDFKIYMTLEKKRLHSLILKWLEHEKNRPEFKIVSTEKTEKLSLNQIELTIRVDRIDELENGEHFIIDYKTNKTNDIYHWFGERIEEPQLPLYCLINPDKNVGIAFAQLTPGNDGMKGISKNALDIQGIKLISEIKKTTALSWDEQIALWNANIIKLSDDFYQGIATVDPKEIPKTCTWCALQPFCRINEEIVAYE